MEIHVWGVELDPWGPIHARHNFSMFSLGTAVGRHPEHVNDVFDIEHEETGDRTTVVLQSANHGCLPRTRQEMMERTEFAYACAYDERHQIQRN